jgi:hypothetical protein
MGEARRRKSIEIKGPMSYEIGSYRLEDIFDGTLRALLGERPSPQASAIMQATVHLAERMDDRSLPTVLCAFCDYEFGRGERPTEIMVALPWANPKHPPIISPICPVCAEASEDDKTNMAIASWSKLSPGSSFGGFGHA